MMKIFQDDNVFDAAVKRIDWLFSEFPNVLVCISGGKDSTVVLNLALMVAEKRNRLPLKVVFIDQEAEWDCVIDYIRTVMNDPRIDPVWFQCPIRLFNATSHKTEWLECWKEGAEWLREREPNSIKENIYGTDRFKELFGAYLAHDYPDQSATYIGGVRCEEAPARQRGLTHYEVYKGVTWGRRYKEAGHGAGHYSLSPIYDWSYTDIWKAIHENGWTYTKLYDYMFQYGIPPNDMRVSNVHHETAFKTLYFLQEIEPHNWDRLTARLAGVNCAGHLQREFSGPKHLPFMFKSWEEYRDHLVDNLTPPEHRDYFRDLFRRYDANYTDEIKPRLVRMQISAVLANDTHSTKMDQFRAAYSKFSKKAGTRASDPAMRELMRLNGDKAVLAQIRREDAEAAILPAVTG
jgi:predicted phosphoadenosine phosphosulfate sulfurtransferase